MFPKPIVDLKPNTSRSKTTRWSSRPASASTTPAGGTACPVSDKPPEINLMGVTALGIGFATYLGETRRRAATWSPATITGPIPARSRRR